jgi:hypothetical protein
MLGSMNHPTGPKNIHHKMARSSLFLLAAFHFQWVRGQVALPTIVPHIKGVIPTSKGQIGVNPVTGLGLEQ